MDRIKEVLEDLGVKYNIDDNEACVEFWTDTAGQDIPTEFEFDGTAEDFVKQFSEKAEHYDVDNEVELFAPMRGTRGIPDSIKELQEDCQEAKDTLMSIAKKLNRALSDVEQDGAEHEFEIPFCYQMKGMLPVKAFSYEEAVRMANEKLAGMSVSDMNDFATYLEDSEEVDEEGIYYVDGKIGA